MNILQEYKKIIFKIIIIFVVLCFFIFYFINNNTSSYKTENIVNNESEVKSKNNETINDSTIYIEIAGAVKNPGVYSFDSDQIRLFDVVEKAGGFNNANLLCINQVQKINDEQKVIIPYNGEECSTPLSDSGSELININTADASLLQELPGIGESKANDIITYREENGLFTDISQLENVSGIGSATIEKLSDLICI